TCTSDRYTLSLHDALPISWWMRRRADHVFARDERTAAALRRAGGKASWAGNLMMDAMAVTGALTLPRTAGPVVALLPGSREDAYVNLRSLAAALERVAASGAAVGLVPLATGLAMGRAAAVLRARGWEPAEREHAGPAVESVPGGDAAFRKGRAWLWVLEGVFGDVLQAADVVVGLAGTANEQAAGLGKPVVAFPGPGVQFGPRFLRAQRLLLGDALVVAPPSPEAVAAEVRAILSDPARREGMAAAGRERMGPPGAARRMADAIGRLWGWDADARG